MDIKRVFDTYKDEGLKGVYRKTKTKFDRQAKRAYSKIFPGRAVLSKYDVYLSPNWDDPTFDFYALGGYGYYLSDYITNLENWFIFIDIGANQGLYSLIAAKNLKCLQVHSFEPVKNTFDLLNANIALNHVDGKISPHRYGISTVEAKVPIYVSGRHSGGASLRDQAGVEIFETIEIKPASSIDPLLPRDVPVIIKIDVEGHEKEVIASIAQAAFSSRIEAIFYEVDENWVSPDEIQSILRKIGFSIFNKIGDGNHYDVMAQR